MVPIVGMIVLFCMPGGELVEAEVVRENPSIGFDLAIPNEAAEQLPELRPIPYGGGKSVVFGIIRGEGAKMWRFGERLTDDHLEAQRVKAEADAAAKVALDEAAKAKDESKSEPPAGDAAKA
jgi:hypothetical protein